MGINFARVNGGRVAPEPAETKTVELTVPVRELAFYGTIHQRWEVEKGEHTVLVGSSSNPADLTLSENLPYYEAGAAKPGGVCEAMMLMIGKNF